MAINNFSPKVWAAKILSAKEKKLVYGSDLVINSDYEGEIAQAGDTVRILTVGDPTIGTYVKGTNIAAPENLTDAALELKVDQQKYFNFQVDDIDKRQAQGGKIMDESTRRAGYKLGQTEDSFVASLYTDIATANFIGSDSTPKTDLGTAGTAYQYLVDLGTVLDESETDEDSRWAIVPPWFHGALEKDARFTGYGTQQNRLALENGLIGEAAGFQILKSNQVPNTSGTKFKVMAGHKEAWSKAVQILETEAYRPEGAFSDAVKGLHVYGAKVVRPDSLACLVANRP